MKENNKVFMISSHEIVITKRIKDCRVYIREWGLEQKYLRNMSIVNNGESTSILMFVKVVILHVSKFVVKISVSNNLRVDKIELECN